MKINNMKVLDKEEIALGSWHKVGDLANVSYRELIEVFGEPTYNPEDSGDGKVNYEWVILHDDKMFTIYDWKTYDVDYTECELDTWSIGGNDNPSEFKKLVYKKINDYYDDNEY